MSNLETHLVDRKRRNLALQLLEGLFVRGTATCRASSSSPRTWIRWRISRRSSKRSVKGIYEDAVPEVEFSRLAVLLTRFHRCYVPFCKNASARGSLVELPVGSLAGRARLGDAQRRAGPRQPRAPGAVER